MLNNRTASPLENQLLTIWKVVAEQTQVVDVNEKQRLLVDHTEVTIKQSKITIRGRLQIVYHHVVCANMV